MVPPELLAPAGSREALDAVIAAGADAVYVAGKRFGMRQHASWLNFDDADLQAAIQYAHEKGKRIYVTVNNLLADIELEQTERFIDRLREWGPDAIILQDLGLLHRLQGTQPPFELHASCMMNTHSLATAGVLGRLGVSRIVASRDITLADAARLQEQSGIEFECFLHGDMCIAQSGQCTTSGIMAGESGSRGRCLKPCRWQWNLVSQNGQTTELADGFLLARNDLCLFEHVPEIVESGVSTMKIEGRARKPEHLARIVRAYRGAFDAYAGDPVGYQPDARLYEDMFEHRIRDFSTCVTFGDEGRDGIGRDGSREPRIFSVVIEQPGLDRQLPASPSSSELPPQPALVVHCADLPGVQAALRAGASAICIGGESWRQYERRFAGSDIRRVGDVCRGQGAKLYWMAPRISESASLTDTAVEGQRSRDGDTDVEADITPSLFDGCYVHSLGQFETARRLGLAMVADHGNNLFNAAAMAFAERLGAVRAVASLELGLAQIEAVAASTSAGMEFVIHGPIVGMISEHCVIEAAVGCNPESRTHGRPPCAGGMALQDVAGQSHGVMTDARCRNHILLPRRLSALPVLGRLLSLRPSHVRIDGRHDAPDVLRRIVTIYTAALDCLCRGRPIADDAMARLVATHPGGLTLGAYGLDVADVSMPGEGLPTNAWVVPSAIGAAPQCSVETPSSQA